MSRILLVLIAIGFSVWGQGSVTIYGSIQDATGAVIPNVEVRITNTATSAVRVAVTNEAGNYIASQLPAGLYSVRIAKQGFKSYVQDNIATQVDENRRIDVRLEVGATSESIEVQAEATQVETRSGALREVIDSKRIVELPLNGRNPLQLQYLVAGSGGVAGKDQAQNETVSINGARANSNNYQLDGGDNHDPYFNSPAIFPSPDALEEFSIQTNSYGADKGRNAGAFMTAVTKSGTNQFHGSAFEFLRNEKLNARNFFAKSVPPFRRNQYGGTFGGPLIRERTFFFFSFQGTKERSAPGAVTATVLTQAQRGGDFSALTRALKDPLGGNFPGNIIPTSRLNQPAQKFLEAFIPLPNSANGLFSFASQQKNDDDQYVGKLDHRLTNNNQLSGRILRNANQFQEATGNMPGFFAAIVYDNWSLAVTDTHIISPTLINTFVFSFNDIQRRQLSVVPGDKTWIDFGAGFTRTFAGEAPAGMHTTVDGYFNAFSRFPLNHFRKNLQFSDMLSWTMGNHFLKIGGDVRRSILDLQELFRGDPYIRFGNTFSGEAAADLVLGLPLQFEQIAEAANKPRVTELSFFVQDDWKLSRRLTLNLGMRWDPWFPFVDELNKFAQIRLGQQSKVFPTAPQGVVFPGDPGTTSSLVNSSMGNLAPRFGFAFDPDGSGKTSIRGGYGIFYSQVRQQANNQIATNQPFSLKLTANNPSGGVNNPYQGFGNPFPFNPPSTPEEIQNYKWSRPLTMTQWNPNLRNAISQQWNLNLQREFFSTWILTGAYVGSKGNHLLMSAEANPGIYGRPGALNQRRPLYPDFGPITDMSSRGNSTYHAMQVTANKRFTQGLSVQANYTWSKLMDDASGDGDLPNNPFNFHENRGRSNFDLPHRFVGSFIWQLPILKGRPALLRHTLGGWETNGIIQLQSGRWLTITSGRVSRYFNTAAFAQNPAGTFGTAGKNILAGPGQATVDFGVIKSFALREAWRLQFRAEMFNLLNRVNLGNPNTNASSAQFGQITSAGAPRVIQLALRLQF